MDVKIGRKSQSSMQSITNRCRPRLHPLWIDALCFVLENGASVAVSFSFFFLFFKEAVGKENILFLETTLGLENRCL
jgi:hypothetical protein